MNQAQGHQGHMWLIGVAVGVALLLGWGVGWALALALLACVAMLGAIFWIGRTSAQAPKKGTLPEHTTNVPGAQDVPQA